MKLLLHLLKQIPVRRLPDDVSKVAMKLVVMILSNGTDVRKLMEGDVEDEIVIIDLISMIA